MSSRRNLVIVLAHGLRSDALGDSAAWPLTTPHILKLAQGGLRLVASSACPADHGGMISLLTGLHARQHGHLDQEPQPMRTSAATAVNAGAMCEGWPSWLAGAGYHVAGVGCVGAIEPWLHEAILVGDLDGPGVSSCAYLHAMADKGIDKAVQQQRRQRQRAGPFEPERLLMEPDDDIDGFIFTQARKALARMPADRAWALIVMLSGPGNGLPAPTLYDQMVDPASVDGFIPVDLRHADNLAELDYPRVMLQRLEPHTIGRIRADYLGRVGLIDYGMGRLSSVLQARNDHQRTWTVLASDRGQLLGEHGLVGHRSFLAGAVEVPVLIVPPTPAVQTRPVNLDAEIGEAALPDQGLVSTVDVAGTIAALGACDPPRAVDARSLLDLFGPDDVHASQEVVHAVGNWTTWRRDSCLSEFGRRLMLETDRYKVIFNTDTRIAMGLYDLLNDPDEQVNLVTAPKGLELLDSLRWRLGDTLMPLRSLPRNGH